MAERLLRKKDFPKNYPADALRVIQAMSITGLDGIEIVGSQSLRSQQYAADYDMIETIVSKASKPTALPAFAYCFKGVIMRLLKLKDCYIAGIKSGAVPEWELVEGRIEGGRVVGFNYRRAIEKLEAMDFLDAAEKAEAHKLLVERPTVEQWLRASQQLKFHIVRWTPKQVLRGSVELRDGRQYTLEDAFQSNGRTKIDVVAFIQSRFTDFSCIYIFKGKEGIYNALGADTIKEDLLSYALDGNFFKVAKRMFLLAARSGRKADLLKLNELLNSDLGLLYAILSDINTLLFLLDEEKNIPIQKIRDELDSFRSRVANVYSVDGANSGRVLNSLLAMEQLPADSGNRNRLKASLEKLAGFFEGLLGQAALEGLKEQGLWELPPYYRA
jgi:hypothetical protein